jgi:PAS domain-containing protein
VLSTQIPTEPGLAERLRQVFGMPSDTMPLLEQRAEELLGDRAIVWEGDAATFQVSYVGRAAEVLLGYPASRWTTEPAFWAETVVHPEDRDDAVAYCALATGQARDHDFVYRAIAADGRVVWLTTWSRCCADCGAYPSGYEAS